MSLIWSSGFNGITDPDAQVYIAAVEEADGEPLEGAVAFAISNFIVGCKQDGIWDAIKACCILAGARTLNGALVPLVKQPADAAPTRFGTEGGWDYSRETGLQGNGTDNYINSGRANNADPPDNFHMSTWVSEAAILGGYYMAANIATSWSSGILNDPGNTRERWSNRSANIDQYTPSTHNTTGFKGNTRNNNSTFSVRTTGSNFTPTGGSLSSFTPEPSNIYLFARNGTSGVPAGFISGRLAFYSIGESLDLEKLDNRTTRLMNLITYALTPDLPPITTMDLDAANYIGAAYRAGGTLS
jgi:hypothetical protein